MSKARLDLIQADLQRASTVIYLEGKSDEAVLLALAGVARPSSGIHKRVYVSGLRAGGQGGKEVRELLKVAESAGLAGRPGSGGIFGIIDGDGRELAQLRASSLAPFQGPLFSWQTYCIENLLSIAWPKAWGATPDWHSLLRSYLPYAALNRVHTQLQQILQTLQLAKFQSPSGKQLKNVEEVKAELARDKQLIAGRDVEAMFDRESSQISSALEASLEEGHALINGKWLVSHHAAQLHPGRKTDELRDEWAKSVRAAGGHPAVRALWAHIAGEEP